MRARATRASTDTDVFLMMPFGTSYRQRRYYDDVADVVKGYFEGLGMRVIRADEKRLDDRLWENITRHMGVCGSGVAIVDETARKTPSPNVFIEIGHMLSFRKPLLVLHEVSGAELPVDLKWMIYGPYSHRRLDEDIPRSLDAWLEQRNLIPPAVAELRDRIRSDVPWPPNTDFAGKHVAVVNFGRADEVFTRYVSYLCQFFRSRRRGTYLQMIFRPRRPRLLVELLLRSHLRRGRRSFELPGWLRMRNAGSRHLPKRVDASRFAQAWFRRVSEQLPDGSACVIICENTSEYLSTIQNKDEFVNFETDMEKFLECYLPDRAVGVVCTYDWDDVRGMVRGPRSPNLYRFRRILNCHDEILVITRKGSCIEGKDAVLYVHKALERLVRSLSAA